MIIKPKATELVWVNGRAQFGDFTLKNSPDDDDMNSGLIDISYQNKYICYIEYQGKDKYQEYAQQWVNALVASIAKPFVVPDDKNPSMMYEYTEGRHDCREETLRLNGVEE